jgi:hypothetical protein
VAVNVKNAAGVILRATAIGGGVDIQVGPPATYLGLGKVVFGSNGALGPVRVIDTDPMVIIPLPPGSDTMHVVYTYPSAGSYQLIPKL